LSPAESLKGRSADPHVRLSERARLPDSPESRFGRLFPDLPCQSASGDALLTYGRADGPLEFRPKIHRGLSDFDSYDDLYLITGAGATGNQYGCVCP